MKKLNILVIKYRPIGDSIMGLSTIHYLKKLFPDSEITYMVQKNILPIFPNNYTSVNYKSLSFSLKDWIKTFYFFKKNRFDIILELQQTGKSRNFFKLFSRFLPVNYYYHNHNHPGNNFILDQGLKKPAIQKDLDGVWSALNHFFTNREFEVPDYLDYPPVLNLRNSKQKNASSILLGISAGRKEKIWETNNYKKLIYELNNIFPGLKFIIPLSKNKFDLEIETEISKWDFKNHVIVKKDIGELPYEMSECNFYIGNDTGLKHLSVSLGMKTLTIFGAENPIEWHPYNLKNHYYVFNGDINEIAFNEVLNKSISLIKSQNNGNIS
jgi:lipopolysaccharide heptosyltransferase II